MTHARTQIVDVVAIMLTGLATTQTRVNKTRVYSRDESELPSVSIFFDGEDSQPQTLRGGQRLIRRIATLRVACHAMVIDGIETQLDQMAEEVEIAMAAPILIGPLEISAWLSATTIDTASTEQQIGEILLTYRVTYATSEDDPGTVL